MAQSAESRRRGAESTQFINIHLDRINRIFLFLSFLLPAIARRPGEAGGDETEKGQSACLPSGIQGYSTGAAEENLKVFIQFSLEGCSCLLILRPQRAFD